MTKSEAKEYYRQLWRSWCMTQDPDRKRDLEVRMDSAQILIAKRPNSEWLEFIETLPGFVEFWSGWALRLILDEGRKMDFDA